MVRGRSGSHVSHARVLAGMNVNIWEGLDDIKQLVRARNPVDSDRLADNQVPLTELAR
jgi:3-phenylpropionate/trans-cinnamate dioxygenase ferredoxin reductase component